MHTQKPLIFSQRATEPTCHPKSDPSGQKNAYGAKDIMNL
jgi:hypothetical protein